MQGFLLLNILLKESVGSWTQNNLRSRVAAVAYYPTSGGDPLTNLVIRYRFRSEVAFLFYNAMILLHSRATEKMSKEVK